MMGRLEGSKADRWANAYFNPETRWCDAKDTTASFICAAQKCGVKIVASDVMGLLLDINVGHIAGVRTAGIQRLLSAGEAEHISK